jgi:hypothetical protein
MFRALPSTRTFNEEFSMSLRINDSAPDFAANQSIKQAARPPL